MNPLAQFSIQFLSNLAASALFGVVFGDLPFWLFMGAVGGLIGAVITVFLLRKTTVEVRTLQGGMTVTVDEGVR